MGAAPSPSGIKEEFSTSCKPREQEQDLWDLRLCFVKHRGPGVVGKPLGTGAHSQQCVFGTVSPAEGEKPTSLSTPSALFSLQFVFGEGEGDPSLADLWPHTPGEIPSHPIPWAHPGTVSLIPKPCPAPAGTPRLKGRVVQKPRCFWCSQNPGEGTAGAATSPAHPGPTSLPHGGDPGQGEPCSCSTTN